MNNIEREYHMASGYCLDAMQSLRRFAGKALRSAIRIIEAAQKPKQHEDKMDTHHYVRMASNDLEHG